MPFYAIGFQDTGRLSGHLHSPPADIVQPVRTDKGTLNRVRVGPVSTRAEADQLKARLASGFGAGMVVPHP